MKKYSILSGLITAMFAYRNIASYAVEEGGGATTAIAATPAADVTATDVQTTGAVQPVQTAEEKAAQHAEIKAKFNNLVDVVETTFHFRKVDNKVKDPETGAEAVVTTKRNSVILPVPAPSVEGLIDIIQNKGGKALELVLEAVRNIVVEQAREYINDNEAVTSLNFPFATLDWDTIANLPKADRRGGGIAKEVWEDFAKDYISIMPSLINKPVDAVTTATKIFLTKFNTCKTNKPVLAKLKDYLAIYISNTTKGEDFAEAVDWLDKKLTTLLETDNSNLLEAL